MIRWLRNRKRWTARRRLLLQGRLDMQPLDQAWAAGVAKDFWGAPPLRTAEDARWFYP